MHPRKHRKEMPCQQVVPGRTEYDVDRLLSHATTEVDDDLPGHFVPDRRPKQYLKLAPGAIGPSITSPGIALAPQPAQNVVAQRTTDEPHNPLRLLPPPRRPTFVETAGPRAPERALPHERRDPRTHAATLLPRPPVCTGGDILPGRKRSAGLQARNLPAGASRLRPCSHDPHAARSNLFRRAARCRECRPHLSLRRVAPKQRLPGWTRACCR